MATDQQPPVLTTPVGQDLRAEREAARATSIALIGSCLIGPAVLVAALSRHLDAGLALVVMAVVVAAGVAAGLRQFVHLFMFAFCLRPLIDLSAGPRGTGVSLTEVFGLAVLVVSVGWLVWHQSETLPRLVRPLPLSLLALVLVQLLATLGSTDPVESLSGSLRIAAGVAVFVVTDVLLATRRLTVRQLVMLVVATSAVPLLYPVLGFAGVTVTHRKDDVDALKSVFFLSNNFAYFLVPLLILGVAWALRARGRTQLLALAYTGVVAVELVLTQTRGAWVCAALGALVVAAVLNRRAAAGLVVAVVAVAVLTPAVNARITSLIPDPDNPREESSAAWRLGQWEVLLPSIAASPVLGGGPGESHRETQKDAHNDYLKAAVDTGMIGLGIYLWMLGAALMTSWRALLRTRRIERDPHGGAPIDPILVPTLAAVAAYAVAIAVASFGDNLIDNVTFLWSTLPLLAIASWTTRASRDELTAPRPTVVEQDA